MAFGYLWCRYRIRAHNKVSDVEKLCDLSLYNFLFTMHQSTSSNLHCRLKSMKVFSDLSLDNKSFLVITQMKQQNFCI